MGDCYSIVELDDGVGKVLGDDVAANVGERPIAGRRSRAASKAKQQQARSDGVGVGDPKLVPRLPMLGTKVVSVVIDPVRTKTSFVQYAGTERVGPRPDHVVDRSMCDAIAQDQQ